MVSTSQPGPNGTDRRRGERRGDDKPFAGEDRRVEPRRKGADRRREPRD